LGALLTENSSGLGVGRWLIGVGCY